MYRISFFILIIQFHFTHSQPLTIDYINNWINKCNPEIQLSEKEKIYILEGIPVEKDQLEQSLKSFDISNPYLFIDYLNSDSVETTFLKQNLLLIMIGTARQLKGKDKRKRVSQVISEFQDDYSVKSNHIPINAKNPVLQINGEIILPSIAKQVLENIKPKKIKVIIHLNHAHREIYGQLAINGLVKIWTR